MFWKKKNIQTVCHHKYKDFEWYIKEEKMNLILDTRYRVALVEPYVCAICKKRIDRVIYRDPWRGSRYDVQADIEECKKKYSKHIKPQPIIEDKINDYQLVDKDFLDTYEQTTQDILSRIRKQKTDNKGEYNDNL